MTTHSISAAFIGHRSSHHRLCWNGQKCSAEDNTTMPASTGAMPASVQLFLPFADGAACCAQDWLIIVQFPLQAVNA